eukprot:m.1352976 g.1352976  ORF g.1352976 m.1352976 type:complete len:1256 (-) comp24929_c0_seq2:177-3944(-)
MDWLAGKVSKLRSSGGNGTDFVGSSVAINGKKLRIKRVLGEGGFGIVYSAIDTDGGQFAVKRMLGAAPDQIVAIEREIKCMSRVKQGAHKHILSLLGVAQFPASTGTPADFQLLMELCPGGHLGELTKQRDLSPAEVVVLFKECSSAVSFLHSLDPPIIHRDIKVENFLLDANGTVKLCDFGSAATTVVNPALLTFTQISAAEEEMKQNTTPQNRAPEMLDMHCGKIVGPLSDVWALGCVLYSLCFRQHPFEDAAVLSIINVKFSLPESSNYTALYPVLQSILVADPVQRPTAQALLTQLDGLDDVIPGVRTVNPLNFLSDASSASGSSAGSGASTPGGNERRDGSFFSRAMGGAGSLMSKARDKAAAQAGALRNRLATVAGASRLDTHRHGGPARDLDLTYICPRIMAMAAPGSCVGHDCGALSAFFLEQHPEQCLVVDVGDRADTYDPSKLLGCKVVQRGWVAGQTPALKRLYVACREIDEFLTDKSGTGNGRNVVAIHCTTGRSDTGLMVAAYLAFARLGRAADVVRLYHLKRMVDGKRVITPSQLRYVQYMQRIANGKAPHRRALHLTKLVLESIPMFNARGTGCRPSVEIYQSGKLCKVVPERTGDGTDGDDGTDVRSYSNKPGAKAVLSLDVDVVGDVRIVVLHEYTMLGHVSTAEMFSFAFHTGFVSDQGLTLMRSEIDDVAKKTAKFDANFGVRIEASIINKQLKKAQPWEAPGNGNGVVGSSVGAMQTCFFSPDEANAFVKDFESTRRAYSDGLRHSTSDGSNGLEPADETNCFSDDEDDMADATPLSPHHHRPATSAPKPPAASGAPPASGGLDALLDFGGSSTASTESTPTAAAGVSDSADLLGIFGTGSSSGGGAASDSGSAMGAGARGDLLGDGGATDLLGGLGGLSMSTAPPAAPLQSDLLGGTTHTASKTPTSADPFGAFALSSSSAPTQAPTAGVGAGLGSSDPFGAFNTSSAGSHGMGSAGTPSSAGNSRNILMNDFLAGGATTPGGTGVSVPSPMQPTPVRAASVPTRTASNNSVGSSADPFGGLFVAPSAASPTTTSAPAMLSTTSQRGTSTGAKVGGISPPIMSQTSKSTAAAAAAPPPAATTVQPSRPQVTPAATTVKKSTGTASGGFEFDLFGSKKKEVEAPRTMREMRTERRMENEDPDKIRVEEWADGKKQNIRTLLASLTDILWEGARWKPVTLGDIVAANKVKRAYQKACLIVHPDRAGSGPHANLAREIFIEVSHAYKLWEDQGGKDL